MVRENFNLVWPTMINFWHIVKTKYSPIALLFIVFFCLLIFLRQPDYFFNPRFWAEEGTVHFKMGYDYPWPKAFFASPHGYYSFLPNLTGIIAARAVPLESAPLITTLFALVIQLIPFFIIFFGQSDFWDTWAKKIVIALSLLFNWTTGEIWLNTVNSQFYLTVTTFLILLSRESNLSRIENAVYCFLLLLAGLTSPVCCFLLPFFILRASVKKSKSSILQAVILGLGTVVQIAVLLLSLKTVTQNRLGWENIGIIFRYIVVKGILRNFLPPRTARILGEQGFLFDLSLILLFFVLTSRMNLYGKTIFAGSFITVSFLSLLFSLDAYPANRYFYAPSVFLMIMLSQTLPQKWKQAGLLTRLPTFLALVLIFLSLHLNITNYRHSLRGFYDPSWPKWKEEVLRWKENPSYQMRIWPPAPQWTIKLDLRSKN